MRRFSRIPLPCCWLLAAVLIGCRPSAPEQWAGQAPVKTVSTATVPVQRQYRGTFDLGGGLYAGNDFAGARLSGIVRADDTLVAALIAPENAPINPSPWYAFQLWSDTPQTIRLQLSYPPGYGHRYYPKLSRDGRRWQPLDSARYSSAAPTLEADGRALPERVTLRLDVGPDTLWVAAQELIAGVHVRRWADSLATLPFVEQTTFGRSREGRPLMALRVGAPESRRLVAVLSRQHPPEVTGYLAMQSFVEALCAENALARRFRQRHAVYVVPLANPDGVAEGHWRHSSAGIDLNRDWEAFHQPETRAIRDFLTEKTGQGKFLFGVDFHSTWEDIYYPMDTTLRGNVPGLVPRFIEAVGAQLPGYAPNVRYGTVGAARVTSSAWLFHTLGAESLTYEIGDDTPRDFVRRKGEVSAQVLMELLGD